MTMFGSKPWPFGRPSYLGSELARACERNRRDNSPDNVEHRQCFIAVVVLLGRASV